MVLMSSAALLWSVVVLAWADGADAKTKKCKKSQFPATGQTTVYKADTQTTYGATVPDTGTVQAGATLRYKDNGDWTITDLNTGLIWEKKVAGSNCLHCVNDLYPWSEFGSTTIWDWLAQVNAQGGSGFTKHKDWRIPNVKELQTLVHYQNFNPAVDAVFNKGCLTSSRELTSSCTAASFYWSSSTLAHFPHVAWFVDFANGNVNDDGKSGRYSVRAVRGGCVH
jgi:hypothetical protein